MSAISSVGSSSASLDLQKLQSQRAQNDHDADDVGPSQSTQGAARAGVARFQSRFEAAAKSIGVDASKLPDIEKQIQDAVNKAQQSTDSSTNPRDAVRNAINGVLKDNGIDPAKFEAALKAQHSQHAGGAHRHHRRGSTANTNAQPTSAITPVDITPKDVQPGQTTGTLVDVAA